MKVDVIVDLQFGSTAKGKVAQQLAISRKYDSSMRVQSIQAGHTVILPNGDEFKMQTIPCAWVNPDVLLYLGPGCFIQREQLMREIGWIESYGFKVRDRLVLDYRATYITDQDKDEEGVSRLSEKMGSTGEGAGASLIRKLWRAGGVVQVKDDDWAMTQGLTVGDTITMMQSETVLLEGCQGSLLGVHTTPYYPFCTSRECSVAAIMAEAGVAPADIRDVFGVARTFPIRVGGNSGSTGAKELNWEEIAEYAGNPGLIPERTTVTNRQRRIFEFSAEDMALSLRINKPDVIVLNFANYVNYEDEGVTEWANLSRKTQEWVQRTEAIIGQKFDILGTSAHPDAWVRRTNGLEF